MIDPLYRGKSKLVRAHSDPDKLVLEFTDRVTDNDGVVASEHVAKGVITCAISCYLFALLTRAGIASHYVGPWERRGMLVRKTSPLPLEVVVRLIAAGSLLTRIPIARGTRITPPLVEFFLKRDEWHDPHLSEDHVLLLGACSRADLTAIRGVATEAALLLAEHFAASQIALVDIKFEFGRTNAGHLILIDEITPDVFRAWDAETGASLDKDVFRERGARVTAAYRALFTRLTRAHA